MESFINLDIEYPPLLNKLSLDYYYEVLHSKFLSNIPSHLESLTLECARISSYTDFSNQIKESNIINLKISSAIIDFDKLF